jgi:hypothetical protein
MFFVKKIKKKKEKIRQLLDLDFLRLGWQGSPKICEARTKSFRTYTRPTCLNRRFDNSNK